MCQGFSGWGDMDVTTSAEKFNEVSGSVHRRVTVIITQQAPAIVREQALPRVRHTGQCPGEADRGQDSGLPHWGARSELNLRQHQMQVSPLPGEGHTFSPQTPAPLSQPMACFLLHRGHGDSSRALTSSSPACTLACRLGLLRPLLRSDPSPPLCLS